METQEVSYIDLLQKLKAGVKFDNIPYAEKANIIEYIEKLENALWKYSY